MHSGLMSDLTTSENAESSIRSTPKWLAYAAAPSGPALGELVAATPGSDRTALLRSVEDFFFESENWRVAQHAALLHLDRFEPRTEHTDLVKAFYFADHACRGSDNDPRARIMMARVNWERRLPLAVFYDVATARAGETRLRSETNDRVARTVLAEAALLEGMARAYVQDVKRAHQCLVEAGEHGSLTVEGLIQLLLAAGQDSPEVSMWVAMVLPEDVVLQGRAGFLQQLAQRRRFLSLLKVRAGTDG